MLFNTNHVAVPYFPIKVIHDKGRYLVIILEENNLW